MTESHHSPDHRTALEVLEREDGEVRDLLDEFMRTGRDLEQGDGDAVDLRSRHGDLGKRLIRHLAHREAALVDVVASIEGLAPLEEVRVQLMEGTPARRQAIDRVETMSRGVQGVQLNQGQDFDGAVQELAAVVRPQIDFELSEAIPTIRRAVPLDELAERFHDEHYLDRHAPTNLSPKGPRWYERAPIVSRVLTVFDRLRDYPRAARVHREPEDS